MDVVIEFQNQVDDEDSFHLRELANLIEKECDLAVQVDEEATQQGTKVGLLAVSLAVAGVALSAIIALISVLSYWKSQRPKYSVSVTRDDKTWTVSNLSSPHSKQLQEFIDEIESHDSASDVVILISRA